MFKCTTTTSKLLLCIRMCALLLSILKYISLLTLLSYIKKKSSTTSSSTPSPGGNIKILILLFSPGGGVLVLLFLCLWPFWNTFWINWKVFAMQPLGSCKKCPLFYVLLLTVVFTMKDRVQKVILYALLSLLLSLLPSLSKEMEPRLGSIGIYYYLYICTTTYKMQSKKILLIHVQSILELIITFYTCFFSLFSLSPSSGSLQLIEGVSVDGNQLYKIIRIIATHFPTSSFLYIHTLHSDV